MNFRVGQKVERISGNEHPLGYGDEILPQYGVVYTVRSITRDGLVFNEFRNPERRYTFLDGSYIAEPRFGARHFRPVVERKTDISIFTEMLTPSPAKSRELCGND